MKAIVPSITYYQSSTMEAPTFAVALPRVRAADAARYRFFIAMAFLGICLAAAGVYIYAVNSMLLAGESIKESRVELQALERDQAALLDLMAKQQSPSWLEEQSRAAGLVEAGNVRYLSSEASVALFR